MVESTIPCKHIRLNGLLTLPSADASFPAGGQVIDSFTLSDEINKPLEQVGSAYEKLKVKISKQIAKYDEQQKKKA
jgi:hypothetical protein